MIAWVSFTVWFLARCPIAIVVCEIFWLINAARTGIDPQSTTTQELWWNEDVIQQHFSQLLVENIEEDRRERIIATVINNISHQAVGMIDVASHTTQDVESKEAVFKKVDTWTVIEVTSHNRSSGNIRFERMILDVLPNELSFLEDSRSLLESFRNRRTAHFRVTRHCLLYTSPSPRDLSTSRMPSSA